MALLINPSKYRHWVDLSGAGNDDTPAVYAPSRVKCAIRPGAPGAYDENKSTHIVEMRYHAQITFNTVLIHAGRHLYVRGIQNVDELNREMVLLCEEVLPA